MKTECLKQILCIIAALVFFSLPFLIGCQVDHQVNSSWRFLQDGEAEKSRQSWAFGKLR